MLGRKDNWKIYQGPRNKSLATKHLEYIVSAMLDGNARITLPEKVTEELIIRINGHKFNLKSIIDAQPDFEQFDFSDQQLDSYVVHLKGKLETPLPKYNLTHLELHPAEQWAIYRWTESYYIEMQNFLRHRHIKSIAELPTLLMTICIASQGLQKLTAKAKEKLIRSEESSYKKILKKERKKNFAEKKLTVNEGFTATTFGDTCTQNIIFHQPDCLNPIAKDIHRLSHYPAEDEVLIPPNTEVKYVPGTESQWQACLFRSLNRDMASSYQHPFSTSQLEEINQNAIKLKLSNIYQALKKILAAEKPYSKCSDLFSSRQRHSHKVRKIAQDLKALIDSSSINNVMVNELITAIEDAIPMERKKQSRSASYQWQPILENILPLLRDLREVFSHAPVKKSG